MNTGWIRCGVALILLGTCHAAGKLGQFEAKGSYTGSPANLTLSATVEPAPQDKGAAGGIYVAALVQNDWLVLGPTGWVPSTMGFPAYRTGPLANTAVPVLSNLDVAAIECAQVFAGYGRTLDAMVGEMTYRSIYQVPALWPRTTPLPCSSMADADAARFLKQATFGATEAEIANVKQLGLAAWINAQFALPASRYPNLPETPSSRPAECDNICGRDKYSLFPLQTTFYKNALTAPDQLRQRVAFALSQILVVSGNEINMAYSYAPYQNILVDNAFGNFRDIMTQVTLSPAMGRYLDMVNNGKPSSASQQANENYARELLQLFTIGLYQLNQDGTVVRDGNGLPVPSYDEEMVRKFALILTGWTYPVKPGAAPAKYNPSYYLGPMVAVATNHENSSKALFNGYVLPAGQTPEKDLADALDNLFLHPNVGPFIGKQLIQHLVTSNPSPAYVARVSDAFANNGQGVRGDLKAVVRAILLDPEARGGMRGEVNYGHLREPVLVGTQLLRALGGQSDGVWLIGQNRSLEQNVFNSPSVFNYYPADYALVDGTEAPQFGIYNTNTAIARVNHLYSMVVSASATGNVITPGKPDTTVVGATGTSFDLSPLVALAGDPAKLVDRLNVLLLHGTMQPTMRDLLVKQVTAAGTDPLVRTRTAIYLTAASTAFQVER